MRQTIWLACAALAALVPAAVQAQASSFLSANLYGDAVLEVPPLRNRREDIPSLASQFLAEANEELQTRIEGIGEDALEKLLSYAWPGNVHQLKAVIRRATLTAKRTIGGDDIEIGRAHV